MLRHSSYCPWGKRIAHDGSLLIFIISFDRLHRQHGQVIPNKFHRDIGWWIDVSPQTVLYVGFSHIKWKSSRNEKMQYLWRIEIDFGCVRFGWDPSKMDGHLGAAVPDRSQRVRFRHSWLCWVLHLEAFERKRSQSASIIRQHSLNLIRYFQTTINTESNSTLIMPTIVVLTMSILQTLFERLAM